MKKKKLKYNTDDTETIGKMKKKRLKHDTDGTETIGKMTESKKRKNDDDDDSFLQVSYIREIILLLLSITTAVITGSLFRFIFSDFTYIATSVTQPLFSMILGLIKALSSPMIFLSVCCGIMSIGNLASFGKIGKSLILRMIMGTFGIGIAVILFTGWLYPIELNSEEQSISGNFSDIYLIVLSIIPSDLVSPFLEGNALQIIFLGTFTGVSMLYLGQRVSNIKNIILQANDIVLFMISFIGKIMPFFIFLSIFNLMLFNFDSDLAGLIKIFAVVTAGCLVTALFYLSFISVKYHVSPLKLIKKVMPTFLIAITTASSATALPSNLETCEKKLGIPKKITDFAIPLGQVIYKPTSVIEFFTITICLAEYYKIHINLTWLITALLIVCLLSIATPPIIGGAAGIFSIMFSQLGIPTEAIALAIAIDSIMDFLITASALTCLQANVTLVVGQLHMLDVNSLKNEG